MLSPNSPSQSTTDISTQESPTSSHDDSSSESSHTLHESGAELLPSIYATSPAWTRRYDLNRKIEDEGPVCPVLKPLLPSFANESPPPGWVRHVHPEGLPYFCRQPSADCPMRILTEEWLFDPDTASKVEDYIRQILNAISQYSVIIPPTSDLVIELDPNDEECGYYFVHHPTRSIYWLGDVEVHRMCPRILEVRGRISGYQIQTCLEAEYWTFWSYFPNVQSLTPEIHEYVVDALTSAITDQITSRDSTITYSYEDLQNMLNVVQSVGSYRTSTWYIGDSLQTLFHLPVLTLLAVKGRFMQNIISDRFRNYYGAWNARLTREQAVLPEPATRSKFLGAFSPLLFFIPHAQLARVSPLAIDGCVIVLHWKRLFKELQDEWDQTMTLATIMLAANCAFLAIPVFDKKGSGADSHSSPEQVASYLSLAASLGGLILSMVMSRQHKAKGPNTVNEILDYIFDTTPNKPRHRLEHLVLIWSLPHALVLWSVVTFLLAFLIMCFEGTHTVAKVAVAISAGLLTSLVFYYIIRFGSGKKLRQLWSNRIFQEVGRIKRLFSTFPTGCLRCIRRRRREPETGSRNGDGEV